jgi:ribose transport system ATP-binding protein
VIPMLSTASISKSFDGFHALKSVNIEIRPNEVVGLVGENGAGKSTLMRILAGVLQPTSGRLLMDNAPITLTDPRHANSKGICMVFQEQSLLPNISVAENVFLGREDEFVRFGLMDWKAMNEAARRHLGNVMLAVDPSVTLSRLTFAERQMVELAKALSLEERVNGDLVILLDEPTSVLDKAEIDLLFARIRALKHRSSFVFVSHRLEEVIEISDRIYVMKDGEVVAEMPAAQAEFAALHRAMVGRSLRAEYYRESEQLAPLDNIALEARGLSVRGAFSGVDLQVREGEVLGIAGVIGSGRERLVRALFGFEHPDEGEIRVFGKPVKLSSPAEAVSHGIGFIPSDRRSEGLVMMFSLAENISLANLDSVQGACGINRARELALARKWIESLSIRPPRPRALSRSFSGGNQQKAVLAKWLTARSRILVLDHPTRGIDVGAKEEVFRLIRQLSSEGVAILLIADTLEETIGLSHSIIVMRDGRVTARVSAEAGNKPSQVELIGYMV